MKIIMRSTRLRTKYLFLYILLHNIGEKPTITLYTYINHHVGTSKQKRTSYYTVFLTKSSRLRYSNNYFVEPTDSGLWLSEFYGCLEFYGYTCSINCTGCTVVYESICYKSMPMSRGAGRQEFNEVQCISCNNPVTTGHQPPTLKHSTTSSVADPAGQRDFLLTRSYLTTVCTLSLEISLFPEYFVPLPCNSL